MTNLPFIMVRQSLKEFFLILLDVLINGFHAEVLREWCQLIRSEQFGIASAGISTFMVESTHVSRFRLNTEGLMVLQKAISIATELIGQVRRQ